MVKYEVWQLPLSSPYKFLHYDWFEEEPTMGDYVMVYSGIYFLGIGRKRRDVVLENLFRRLNLETPIDYRVAPVSVSDVICLINDYKRTWWYVDGVGFKQLDWGG